METKNFRDQELGDFYALMKGNSMFKLIFFAVAAAIVSAPVAAETIKVKRATYRGDVSHACDATSKVREVCKDQDTCIVSVDNNLCGDPMFGAKKTLLVEYSCGRTGKSVRGDEGTDVSLSCE